jgi:hypothetical protein
MKKLLLAIVAVAVLGVGGLFGWAYLDVSRTLDSLQTYVTSFAEVADAFAAEGDTIADFLQTAPNPLTWTTADRDEWNATMTRTTALHAKLEAIDPPSALATPHRAVVQGVGRFLASLRVLDDFARSPGEVTAEKAEAAVAEVEQSANIAGKALDALQKAVERMAEEA